MILALDFLEHLSSPEKGVREIYDRMNKNGCVVASTGNIAFFVTRCMLLLGAFNYGKKGILDLTHKRLFTINSFKRLFEQNNFKVDEIKTFGMPLTDLIGNSFMMKLLEKISCFLAKVWPGMFAYQVLIVAKPLGDISQLELLTFDSHTS